MKNKKVVVVGGTSGIGLSVAKLAGKAGADVIVASRSAQEQSEQLSELLENVEFISVDVTSEKEICALFDETGSIDHLVMTVKPEIVPSPFLELNTDDVHKAFETKFWGQYRLAKAAYKFINEGGSIIFSSGIASHRPYENFSTASIMNGAVESLCKILAVELAPLRVNAVSPGFAVTKNKTIQEMSKSFPLKELGSPDDIANAYMFLMNDRYTTGTVITSDGGATLV